MRRLVLAAVTLLGAVACAPEPGDDGGGNGGSGGPGSTICSVDADCGPGSHCVDFACTSAPCSVGSEGCLCTSGGACDPGLDCRSALCVDLGAGGSGGGGAGGGGAGGFGGVAGSGGAGSGGGGTGEIRVTACEPATAAEPERCTTTQVEPPSQLYLGTVIQGTVRTAQVTIHNDGDLNLRVNSVRFADAAEAALQGFALVGDVERGVDVPPQSGVDFNVELALTGGNLGVLEVAVLVASDDRDEPEVELTIQANAVPNSPPVACLFIRSILHRDGSVSSFAPGDLVPTVEPLETVTLDALPRADCSFDPEDGLLVGDVWEVAGPDQGILPRTVAGQPFQRELEVELPGRYTVSLSIVDSLGERSATDAAGVPAEVVFDVQPRQDIGASLTWVGSRFVDLDLHFVRPGGSIWDAGNGNGSDCHWDNTDPNWGDPQTTSDDPLLAIDDVGTGNLLEIVELNQPATGDYQVFVHFFDDARSRAGAVDCAGNGDCVGAGAASVCSVGKCMAPVEATIDLYLAGGRVDLATQFPAFRNPQPLARPCDLWFVGIVHWPTTPELLAGTPPTFVPSGAPVIVSGTPTGTSCNPPRP